MEKDFFVGQIGQNVPRNIEEKEEDLLEALYERWRTGKSMEVADIMIDLKMKRRELSMLLRRMQRHGYLVEALRSGALELTDFGRVQGAECMSRHQYLTQFLQLVSGMNPKEAQESACRMEHVMNAQGIRGISDFLKYGDVYDRIIENFDLRAMYELGTYPVCIGLYCMDRRSPRVLAEEFDLLQDETTLEINDRRSWFHIRKQQEITAALWYLEKQDWIRAEEEKAGWRIPTDAFTFTISTGTPVMDGTAIVAFAEQEHRPKAAECRELNVHI
ncbi:MAG: metal-dependent transcriptional regulator [Eubacteriales bacterium]|nr:metal-dependent transcriptional regulator [Eubacteriales bacterium]